MQSGDRVPPNHLEAERAVLGAIFIDNAAVHEAREILVPEDFYQTKHRHVFATLQEMAEQSEPFDVVTVGDRLRTAGHFETVGGFTYLNTLLDAVPTSANIAFYAEMVRDAARLRRALAMATEAAAEVYAGPADVGEFLSALATRAAEVAAADARAVDTLMSAQESCEQTYAHVVAVAEGRAKPRVVPTGLRELDAQLGGGWWRKEFVVIPARPGMGKSSFIRHTAIAMAEADEGDVLIFTQEMSREEQMLCLLASLGRVSANRLRVGALRDGDWMMVSHASSRISRLPLYIDEQSPLSSQQIIARARQHKRRRGRLAGVLVDHLHRMKHPARGAREDRGDQRIAATCEDFANAAKELDCPVIAAAQLNRKCEDRPGDKRPQLQDIRESGGVEENAHTVVCVYRDWIYNRETAEPHTAELLVRKNRNGPIGEVKVGFDFRYTAFADEIPMIGEAVPMHPAQDYRRSAANDA